jgi:recombinational DNA repair protein RecR
MVIFMENQKINKTAKKLNRATKNLDTCSNCTDYHYKKVCTQNGTPKKPNNTCGKFNKYHILFVVTIVSTIAFYIVNL